MLRAARCLAACLVAALPLASCGGDASDDGAVEDAATDAGRTRDRDREAATPVVVDTDPADVAALDNTFHHQVIQVASGTTVRWTNKGRQDHDVVPVEGDGWGVDADGFHPGDVYEHTFERPGTYAYYCTIHATPDRGMIGTVIVE